MPSDQPEPAVEPNREDDDWEWATLEGLMEKWNSCDACRTQLLTFKSLLKWPSDKHTGVITFETMGCNGQVLEKVLEVWCPQLDKEKTVPMESLRDEVGVLTKKTCLNFNGFTMFHQKNFQHVWENTGSLVMMAESSASGQEVSHQASFT